MDSRVGTSLHTRSCHALSLPVTKRALFLREKRTVDDRKHNPPPGCLSRCRPKSATVAIGTPSQVTASTFVAIAASVAAAVVATAAVAAIVAPPAATSTMHHVASAAAGASVVMHCESGDEDTPSQAPTIVGRADPEPSNKPEWSEVPETKRGADGACPLLSFVIDTGTDHASEILTSSEMPPQGTLFTSWSLPVERLESGLSAASVEYFVQVTSMRTVSSVSNRTDRRQCGWDQPQVDGRANVEGRHQYDQDARYRDGSVLNAPRRDDAYFLGRTRSAYTCFAVLSSENTCSSCRCTLFVSISICEYVSSRSTQHVVLVGVPSVRTQLNLDVRAWHKQTWSHGTTYSLTTRRSSP